PAPHSALPRRLRSFPTRRSSDLNAARNIAIMAGLPFSCGGTTVNRLCGSSLQSLNQAAHAIMAGFEDVQIVGGFEHMHHLPMDQDRKSTRLNSSHVKSSYAVFCL